MDQQVINRRQRYSIEIRKEFHQKLRIEIRKTFTYEICGNGEPKDYEYNGKIDGNARNVFKDWITQMKSIRVEIQSKYMNQFEINNKVIQQTMYSLRKNDILKKISPFFLLDLIQYEILQNFKISINFLQNNQVSLEMSNSSLKSILDDTQIISAVILGLSQQSIKEQCLNLSQTQRSMLDAKILYLISKMIKQDLDYIFVGYEGYIYGCNWMSSYLHAFCQCIQSLVFIDFWGILSEREHFKVKEYCFQSFMNMLNKLKNQLSEDQIQSVIKIIINFISISPQVKYDHIKKCLPLFFRLLHKSRTLNFQYTFTYFVGWEDQQIFISKQKQQIFLVNKIANALLSTLKQQTSMRVMNMLDNGCFQWLIPCITNLTKSFKHVETLHSSSPVIYCYKDLLIFLNKFYQTDITTISKLFKYFPNIWNLYEDCLILQKNQEIKNTILFGISNLVVNFKELYLMGQLGNKNTRENMFINSKEPKIANLLVLMRQNYEIVKSKSKIYICIIVRNIIIGLQHICTQLGQQHIFLLLSKKNKGQALKNLVYLLNSMLSEQYIVQVILNGLKNFKYLLLLISEISDDTFQTEESYQIQGQLNSLMHQIKLAELLEKLSFHQHTQIQLHSTQLINFLEKTKGDFHYLS